METVQLEFSWPFQATRNWSFNSLGQPARNCNVTNQVWSIQLQTWGWIGLVVLKTWLVVWNMTGLWLFHHIGNGMSSSQLTLTNSIIFQRGWLKPPTRLLLFASLRSGDHIIWRSYHIIWASRTHHKRGCLWPYWLMIAGDYPAWLMESIYGMYIAYKFYVQYKCVYIILHIEVCI